MSDSLVGVSGEVTLTVALADIARLETERVSTWRTIGAVGATLAAAAIIATANNGGSTHQTLAGVLFVAAVVVFRIPIY